MCRSNECGAGIIWARTEQGTRTLVNADPDLLYKDVVEVIDVAKGAGVDKIGLMTEQIQAGK